MILLFVNVSLETCMVRSLALVEGVFSLVISFVIESVELSCLLYFYSAFPFNISVLSTFQMSKQ